MSKRDTIIVAVLINIGLLAILFMFARNTDDDKVVNQAEIAYKIEETPLAPQPLPVENATTVAAPSAMQTTPRDEVDDVLKGINSDNKNTMTTTPEVTTKSNEPVEVFVETLQATPVQEETAPIAQSEDTTKYIEVTVKKGDFLEKIARANGTSIDEIKRINNLNSDKLSIGQILKVPANAKSKANATTTTTTKKADKVETASGPVYHTIKSGDNPWKIARQYKVKYEDILKLNSLNEDKARNLKVGDKIRVK